LFAASPLLLAANATTPETIASPDERALIEVEQQWLTAEIQHDAAALRRLLDDHFIATFGDAKPMDKEAFINDETRGPPDPSVHQTLSDRKVIIADRTAIILDIDTLSRTKDGKQSTMTWRFTTTYIKRGDRWFALAEHGGPTKP
jgi:ketosteroid isomerase-like protein